MTTATASPALVLDEKHVYRVHGQPVPGVTETLRRVGLIDPRWFTDEACERGTAVHQAIEGIEAGTMDWLTFYEPWLGYLAAYERFKLEHGVRVMQSELSLYCTRPRFAGTLDQIAEVDGTLTVVDYKTGEHEPAQDVQIAAYLWLVRDDRAAGEVFPKRGLIVQLCEDGKPKLHTPKVLPSEAETIFRSALNIVNFQGRKS